MWRSIPIIPFVAGALCASGCATASHQASEATKVRLAIRAKQPQTYSVCVALEETRNYPVEADGRVSFLVPSFQHGCDMYLLGAIKVRDGSAESVRVVEVRRGGQTVRRLSLADIARLSKDETGYSIVRVGD